MALQDLLKTLRAQAAERRAQELERGRAEAARIRLEAESELERRHRDFVARTREEEEAVARRALSRAEVEAAGGVLAARDRLLDRVREAVERKIAGAADDAGFRDGMVGELRSALDRLPAEEVVVRAPEGLVSVLREVVQDRPGVALEEVGEMGQGFSALSAPRGLEIDATLETRLEFSWPRLAVAVLREVGT